MFDPNFSMDALTIRAYNAVMRDCAHFGELVAVIQPGKSGTLGDDLFANDLFMRSEALRNSFRIS